MEISRLGRFGLPRAQVKAIIGSVATEKAISMIAIHAHGIPYIFPDAVTKEADAAGAASMSHREDWRSLPLITIDPADAKDHDDAVLCRARPLARQSRRRDRHRRDCRRLLLRAAEIGARPRSAEARQFGLLSRPRRADAARAHFQRPLLAASEGVDRPALAVRMCFSKEGRKAGHTFHRIMMKSAAKLSYQQAQAAIDGKPDDKTGPLLEPILKPLWAAYATLTVGRNRRQPLELDMPERKILLKADGTVDRVVVPDRARCPQADRRNDDPGQCRGRRDAGDRSASALIYRVHDAPSLAKQESLREFLATLDISLAKGGNLRSNHFNGILSTADRQAVSRPWSTRWCCARRARRSTALKTSVISAST